MVQTEFFTHTKMKERGQMTIPSKIRSLIGINAGEELIIMATKKEIVIRPKIKDPIKMAGMLGKGDGTKTVKELIMRYRNDKNILGH